MKMVEATLIMPVTCLITTALIALVIHMYNDFYNQTKLHDAQREELYQTQEVTGIRLYDRLYEEFTE